MCERQVLRLYRSHLHLNIVNVYWPTNQSNVHDIIRINNINDSYCNATMLYINDKNNIHKSNRTNKLHRVLMTMFSLLLILVEFPDLFPFLQHSIITTTTTTTSLSDSPPRQTTTTTIIPPLYITNWIPRGVFYIFLSIICFEQSIVVRAIDEERHASTSSRFFDGIFIVVSGWCMMLVLWYILCTKDYRTCTD